MLLQLDGTLILIAISFIIFVVIMQRIFYTPMTQVRGERENYINNNLELSKEIREKIAGFLKEYDNKITQARIKANTIVNEQTTAANKEKSSVLEKTAQEVNEQLDKKREGISKDKEEAVKTLKPQIINLAHQISTRVLGEEVPISGITHEMIDKALNR